MSFLQPYNIKNEYTLAQLEQYWPNFDKSLFNSGMYTGHMLNTLCATLVKLKRNDQQLAVEKIKDFLISVLTAVADEKIRPFTVRTLRESLMDVLQDAMVRRAMLDDPVGRYAYVFYVLDRALEYDHGNKGRPLTAGQISALGAYFALTRNVKNAGAIIWSIPEHPILPQIASLWMTPAWRTLVEPNIATFDDLFREVWLARPPLAYPEEQPNPAQQLTPGEALPFFP